MRRLKKNIFLGLSGGLVAVLGLVRWTHPEVAMDKTEGQEVRGEGLENTNSPADTLIADLSPIASEGNIPLTTHHSPLTPKTGRKHPVLSVPSYAKCFPDVQDVQIRAARRWGIRPVPNREAAEHMKDRLVYIGASPFYLLDTKLTHSIPYLVPRAEQLLSMIGRNYMDSLYVKGIPMHRIIVSSILRTEADVASLQRGNSNATDLSCHLFGTTFDICYNRFSTVSPPDEPSRRAVQSDTLKWVLSEVLRDVREEGRCYVKYEVKQGCFHVTVR